MGANSQNSPAAVMAAFTQITADFSQYLSERKKPGKMVFSLSEAAQNLMTGWGKSPGNNPFLFQGPEDADVFIIDSESTFFKGESGELLLNILKAMTLSPETVFICNSGHPEPLNEKIRLVSPRVIITLGPEAGQALLGIKDPLDQFRGRFHEYLNIKVMPTFHPSLVKRRTALKRQVWEDMKLVMQAMGLS